MNDFEDQIGRGLRAAADRVTTRSTEVDLIMSAGTQRAKRRQARLALGGVLVAGVAVVGSVAVLTRDRSTDVSIAAETDSSRVDSTLTDRPPVAAPEPVPAGDGSASVVPSNLTWRSVDVDSSEALGVYSYWGAGLRDGGLYEVATEPGRTSRSTPVLWRSDDGLSWQAGSELPFLPRSVATSGGSIYAVGTAPSEGRVAKAAGGEAAVMVSSDGGTTWDTTTLPLDLVAIEELPGVSSVMVNSWVVDGPAGVLVLVQPWAMPDLSGVSDYDPNYGSVVHEDGVALFGSDGSATTMPCAAPSTVPAPVDTTVADSSTETTEPPPEDTVWCDGPIVETRRLTWAEFGADADAVRFLRSRLIYAYSIGADGTVTEVGSLDLGDIRGQFSGNAFVATDSTYVLMANAYADDGTSTGHTFTSTDGANWTRTDLPTSDYINGPVPWSGGLAGAIQRYDDQGRQTDTQVVLSGDGVAWSAVDLDPVLDQVGLEGDPWLSGLVGGDSGITVLVGFQPAEPVGPIAAPAPDTSPDTAPDVLTATSVPGPVYPLPTYAVLHSTDGVRWSVDVLDELREVGTSVGLRQVGNQVVVGIQKPTGVGDLAGQLALVATPTT